MNPYQLIIFDFDGTLAITHQAIISCARKTFQLFNITPPAEEEIRSTIGIPLASTFKLLHPTIIEKDIPKWVETYREFYRTEGSLILDLFPGTEAVIQSAYSADLKLVVLSNKHIKFVCSALDKFKLDTFFSLIVGDDGANPLKPDSAVFHSLIRPKFPHVLNNQILVVGDSQIDLLFAKNAGLDACWATYGYGNPAKCLELNPKFRIDDISQLMELFRIGSILL